MGVFLATGRYNLLAVFVVVVVFEKRIRVASTAGLRLGEPSVLAFFERVLKIRRERLLGPALIHSAGLD